ncbi:hypothetical protein [Patulibacter sp. SYSU D01012]|nr:hypothetical protein [Patulibacter sp. SYSU D01012]
MDHPTPTDQDAPDATAPAAAPYEPPAIVGLGDVNTETLQTGIP